MDFRHTVKGIVAAALAAAGLGLAVSAAAAATLELKHGTFLPPRHPSVAAMHAAAADLAAMTDGRVTVELDVTGYGSDPDGTWATADGWLWVDGRRIYHVTNLGLRAV